jgi:signal transduction histidine kinase/DNA-binding response OmpR family regulator
VRNPRPTPPDHRPADPSQTIADLRRQLDERTAERDEALAQQTATAEILQVINASPGDLAPVFDAMLEKALGLCDANFGHIYSFDGALLTPVAVRGGPKFTEWMRQRGPIRPTPDLPIARVVFGEDVLHISDVQTDESYRSSQHFRAQVDAGGWRSVVAVALRKEARPLGALVIFREEVRPFSDKQIALLQNFAAQAVIAMENARLITETREALEQQTATAEVLQVINSSPGDLAPVFEALVDRTMRLCDAVSGTLWTYDGERFAPMVVSGASRLGEWFRLHRPTRAAPATPGGRILGGERIVHIADCTQDEAYHTRPRYQEMVDIERCRTLLGVALWREDTLLGMITVYRQEVRLFSEKQIALVENFAAQAVIAMENARLLGEIQQRQAELRVTFDNMGDGVAMFDAEMRLAAWNMNFQKILDLPDDFVATRPTLPQYVDYLAARGEYPSPELEAEIRRGVAIAGYESRFERSRPDGRVIEVRRNAVPGGGSVLIFSDITERKQAELELAAARDAAEDANRTKSAFLANMSHELRTPLNAIIGVTEMLQEDARDLDRADELEPLDRVSRAGRHLLALINDILDLSKIEAGRMELQPERFSITELVDEVTKTIEPLAVKNGNRLIVRDSGAVGTIYTDQMRVRQALMNLVSNAVKFTENGTVTISTSKEDRGTGSRIAIVIEDTGIGMSPEQLGRLFQEFSQADSSTTRRYGGTGLGLVISQRFCQMMGGDITVESELGRGSAFTILLPAEMTNTAAVSEVKVPGAAPANDTPTKDGARVLVVDDDATAREIIGRYLEREGFEVAMASGGREGLRLASALNPTAITLDIAMPDLDGWAVLAALKGNPATSHIPVVLLTIVDEKSRGFALGATEYLVKPIDREQLIRALRQIGGSSGDLLIIDDDDLTRHGIKNAVAKLGWRVTEAENGRIALERMAHLRPDAILLDLMMPTMDGFEFLEEMRRHDDWADIPIIVVTARDLSEEDRIRINGRIERVIHKTGGSELLVEVRQALERNIGRQPTGKAAIA